MALASDITPDDMKVFIQEAESLLELLDEDIIRLEQEADDADLLQEIFRAAHTLKGSSGMLGFAEMAGLTHAMEDVLDRVRKRTLPVTPELIDALLMSLDGLKVLRDTLVAGQDATLDIAPMVDALHAIAQGETASKVATVAPGLASVVADPSVAARVQSALAAGQTLYRVTVRLDPQSDWAAVRSFQVLNDLSVRGEVIASVPSQQEIEEERAAHVLTALVATDAAPEEIEPRIAVIADVIEVTFELWDPAADAAPAQAAVVAQAAPSAGGEPAAREVAESAKTETLQSVRIDVEVLDRLMNMIGELVIDRTRIAQISRTLSSRYKEDEQVRALAETSTHFVRAIDALHEGMMQVRMLPVGLLFSKFPRLVRDLARSTGKEVRLVVDGEGTEIDRSVIEKIKDPLVHLIRNAVDHGVESAEERRAAGKPEQATVKLSAQHESGHIVITLVDDGRGIDARAVRESAVRKGVITAEAAERLSDADAVDLIFEPGLSTAQTTTEVSGRGVGMDIVRRSIEELSGEVEVETTPGQGTRFALRLPLTLATFGGLLVRSGSVTYAIPLSYVQETVRPEPTSLSTVLTRPVMNLRGNVMPVVRLGDAIAKRGTESAQAGVQHMFAVVVRTGDQGERSVAIAVEELVDQQEIVVKSLGSYLGKTRGIAGATILGDGQVVLIVDVPSLIKGALQGSSESAQSSETAQPTGTTGTTGTTGRTGTWAA